MVVAKVLLRLDLGKAADTDVLSRPFAQVVPRHVIEHQAMLSEDFLDRF
jgi:hypothetical protein